MPRGQGGDRDRRLARHRPRHRRALCARRRARRRQLRAQSRGGRGGRGGDRATAAGMPSPYEPTWRRSPTSRRLFAETLAALRPRRHPGEQRRESVLKPRRRHDRGGVRPRLRGQCPRAVLRDAGGGARASRTGAASSTSRAAPPPSGFRSRALYCGSKAALEQFTLVWRTSSGRAGSRSTPLLVGSDEDRRCWIGLVRAAPEFEAMVVRGRRWAGSGRRPRSPTSWLPRERGCALGDGPEHPRRRRRALGGRMLTLYFAPRTRAVRVRWLLEELACPTSSAASSSSARPGVRAADAAREAPGHRGRRGRHRRVGAIVEYMLERYGEGRLAPPIGSPLRGPFLQWVHFAEADRLSARSA